MLALPGAACAHGTRYEGFHAVVERVDPQLPGLLVTVLDGDERLSVRNWTGEPVVLLDARGRPLARLAPGASRAWHEPRIHASGPPPERTGVVRRWRIRGRAGGRPFAIHGFLGYAAPATAPETDEGRRTLAIVGLTLVVLGALALPLVVRRKGESSSG